MTALLWILGVIALIGALSAAWTWYLTRKIDAALPAQGQWVDVAGGRIHYVEMGRTPAARPS